MRIFSVDVNVEAFKEYESLDDLKNEPGKIFGHLPSGQQAEGYKKLWERLDPPAPAEVAATTPAAAEGPTSVDRTSAVVETANEAPKEKPVKNKQA